MKVTKCGPGQYWKSVFRFNDVTWRLGRSMLLKQLLLISNILTFYKLMHFAGICIRFHGLATTAAAYAIRVKGSIMFS